MKGLLYDYQTRWFLDRARFKAGRFARQTGKTFTTTLEIVDDVHEAESQDRRSPWVILSRGERQAMEAMEEGVERHIKAYSYAAKSIARENFDFYDEDSGVKRRGLQLIFPGKSKVTALPANADTARGFSANMFFDEFAFHPDSRKIWAAAYPIISAGWKVRVTSTPNGKGNKFYDICTSDDPIWSQHVVAIHQAIAQGLPRNADELKRGLGDDDIWSQEYELQWLDEASSWLSYDLINSVEHDHAGLPQHYTGGPCYVGVDIAARNDLFVIWVDEIVGDVAWTREIITRKRVSFAEQDALLDDVFRRYKVIRACIDQTGMGEKPVEDAQRRHGSLRVEGVLFTGPNKLHLATLGKQSFEDRKTRIPMGDQALRADLHKLRRETSVTGAPRFVADSDSEGHADRAWACFLAKCAADKPRVKIDFQSTGVKRFNTGLADFVGA
jgi:phage FluMu gp28-like protein